MDARERDAIIMARKLIEEGVPWDEIIDRTQAYDHISEAKMNELISLYNSTHKDEPNNISSGR